MKKWILAVFALVLTMALQAQDTQKFFETLTGKYADTDGFSASMLTNDMFDLYLKRKKIDESSEVAMALKNLDRIMVVSQSKVMAGFGLASTGETQKSAKTEVPDKLHGELLDHYKNGGYTLFKTEKRMGEDVKVYLKKDADRIASLALVTNSSAATGLVELDGDIDLSNVASLSSALNLRGLENLYKIDNSGPVTVTGYASAEFMTQERIAEMEARAREMAERHALSEEQMARVREKAEQQAQRQMELAEKQRELAEMYRRQPVFLSQPGDSIDYFIDGKKVSADAISDLNPERIEKVEVIKSKKEGERSSIKITTKK